MGGETPMGERIVALEVLVPELKEDIRGTREELKEDIRETRESLKQLHAKVDSILASLENKANRSEVDDLKKKLWATSTLSGFIGWVGGWFGKTWTGPGGG